MADNSIKIDSNKRLGFELQRVADLAQSFEAHLVAVKAAMDAADDGSTRASVEGLFGLPTGKGAATVTLIANALTAWNAATACQQLADWMGGIAS